MVRLIAASACLVATIVVAARGLQLAAPDARPDSAVVPYFIADGDRDSGYRPSDRELAVWAFDAWSRSARGTIRLKPAGEQEALIRLYWSPPNGSTYGEMRPLVVGNRRGAAVYVRPDVDALGPEIASRTADDPLWRDAIVYLTCLHELGHAFGLAHTADARDIMYFFGYGGDIVEYFSRYRRQLRDRRDIATVAGLSASDVERLRAARTTVPSAVP
jgi:hypothetical protein